MAKNITLAGASVLVGVLFAVFGQIYQTGADAYDFFLGWTIFITLWVLVSNFRALWLIYIVLVNTTFMLYSVQIAKNWNGVFVLTMLFVINFLFLFLSLLISEFKKEVKVSNWFSNILALISISFSTIGFLFGLFEKKSNSLFLILILLMILSYSYGVYYSFKKKRTFYISIISLSAIMIISFIFIKITNGGYRSNETVFLFISIFIIVSVTFLIKKVIKLQKIWHPVSDDKKNENVKDNQSKNSIASDDSGTSLTIKIISVIGGFFATFTFIGFLALVGALKSELSLIVWGLIFILTVLFINKKSDKIIFDTISISGYMSGLSLFMIGLGELEVNENIIALILIFIAFAILIFIQNYIISLVNTLIIMFSMLFFILNNDLHNLIHLHISVNILLLSYWMIFEERIMNFHDILTKLHHSIRAGLIISLLLTLALLGERQVFNFKISSIYLSSIVSFLIILYLIYLILNILEIKSIKSKSLVYLISIVILSTIIFAPMILTTILIILLSFLVNYKTGFVIGIIALVYSVSRYYYNLHFTLLTKSIILFLSGVLFILFFLVISKKAKTIGVQNGKI